MKAKLFHQNIFQQNVTSVQHGKHGLCIVEVAGRFGGGHRYSRWMPKKSICCTCCAFFLTLLKYTTQPLKFNMSCRLCVTNVYQVAISPSRGVGVPGHSGLSEEAGSKIGLGTKCGLSLSRSTLGFYHVGKWLERSQPCGGYCRASRSKLVTSWVHFGPTGSSRYKTILIQWWYAGVQEIHQSRRPKALFCIDFRGHLQTHPTWHNFPRHTQIFAKCDMVLFVSRFSSITWWKSSWRCSKNNNFEVKKFHIISPWTGLLLGGFSGSQVLASVGPWLILYYHKLVDWDESLAEKIKANKKKNMIGN